MGWDGIFKKIFVPWDGTMFKIFRPIPSHGTEFSEKRPMGWDYPIPRGALLLTIMTVIHIWFLIVEMINDLL